MGGKKMKRLTTFGAFFIVILIAGSVFASGVALTGIGARATALGGNYRAIANDWSAMFWNPAGLTQIQGFHAGLSFELIMPSAKYTFAQSQNVLPFSIFRTGELENEPKTFPVPAVGFVYGTGKMSFGLAVFAPFGLGAEWEVMDASAYNSDYPDTEFEDDLEVIDIHPTFAYQLTDKLSVGAGFSFVLSNILIRKPTLTPNPLLADPAYAPLKQALLTPMGLAASTYDYILTDTKLKGDGTGVGANFGIKYNLTEDLSVGLSGNWYNDVSLDGKITASTYYAKVDPTIFATLQGNINAMVQGGMLTAAQAQQILGVYSGIKQVKYDNEKGDATLPLPMTLGGGLAYTGINNLLISADVSWTQWSAWDVIPVDLEDGTKMELVEDWKDGVRFGVGLEYKLMDPLTLRAGYYTEPTAVPDQTLTISIPDISRRHSISVGASYMLGPLNLFASYEKILIGDRTIASWDYNAQAQGFDNMAGTYKMKVDNAMLGVGYHF
jgi:long-chain fatty acid transport protein